MEKEKNATEKKKFKLSQLVVGGVFFSFILLALVLGMARKRVFNEGLGMSLAVVGEEGVSLLGIRPEEDGLTWVDLPTSLRLRVVDSDAWYPINSLWELGKIEGREEELVITSLQQDLGLVIAGVVYLGKKEVNIDGLMTGLISLTSKSSLNWWDRLVLYRVLGGMMKRGLVWQTDLPQLVMNREEDEDGLVWKKLNERVWVWSKDLWPSEKILGLGATAAVYNVSETSGKARMLAYALESEGLRVVEMEARDEKIEGCWYETNRQEGEMRWLMERQLGCRKKKNLIEESEAEVDLVVWRGN